MTVWPCTHTCLCVSVCVCMCVSVCVFCRHHLCPCYILFDEPFFLTEQLDITCLCLESRKACFQIC